MFELNQNKKNPFEQKLAHFKIFGARKLWVSFWARKLRGYVSSWAQKLRGYVSFGAQKLRGYVSIWARKLKLWARDTISERKCQ